MAAESWNLVSVSAIFHLIEEQKQVWTGNSAFIGFTLFRTQRHAEIKPECVTVSSRQRRKDWKKRTAYIRHTKVPRDKICWQQQSCNSLPLFCSLHNKQKHLTFLNSSLWLMKSWTSNTKAGQDVVEKTKKPSSESFLNWRLLADAAKGARDSFFFPSLGFLICPGNYCLRCWCTTVRLALAVYHLGDSSYRHRFSATEWELVVFIKKTHLQAKFPSPGDRRG